MDVVKIGLINKHKRMPTRKFMLDGTEDMSNMDAIREKIEAFVIDYVWVQQTIGTCINQNDTEMVMCYTGSKELFVYTFDTDVALVAILVSVCAKNGVKLTLSVLNENTGNWAEQKIF